MNANKRNLLVLNTICLDCWPGPCGPPIDKHLAIHAGTFIEPSSCVVKSKMHYLIVCKNVHKMNMDLNDLICHAT